MSRELIRWTISMALCVPGFVLGRVSAECPLSNSLADAKFARARSSLPELLQEKLCVARACYLANEQEFQTGRGDLLTLFEAELGLQESELALADSDAGRIAALERHWDRTQRIEQRL